MPKEIVLRPPGKLTAAWLDRIRIENGLAYEGRNAIADGIVRVTIKDTDVRGLELRLSSTGARSWAVCRRVKGVQKRHTIPNSSDFSLAEARKAAEALRTAVNEGRDPTQERRETRQKAQLAKLGIGKAWTIKTLVEEYGRKVAMPAAQRSWEERKDHVLKEFKPVADYAIADLTDAHFWRVLDAATERGAPVTAWHALRYLRTVLGWGLSRKLIDRDPTAELPLKDIRKRMKERPRERVLSPDELGRLWRVLQREAGSVYAAVLLVAGLTAQRLGEVTAMRWSDLDRGRREWRQPTNKSDRPHVVPLSDAAMSIIEARQPRKGVAEVFTTSAGGRLARKAGNIYRAKARYSHDASVTGWTPHDLRRTAATILAEAKVAPVVIEQLLNHAEGAGKGTAVAGIYNRFSYALEKRHAVDLLAEKIALMARDEPAEVVEIGATKRVGT